MADSPFFDEAALALLTVPTSATAAMSAAAAVVATRRRLKWRLTIFEPDMCPPCGLFIPVRGRGGS